MIQLWGLYFNWFSVKKQHEIQCIRETVWHFSDPLPDQVVRKAKAMELSFLKQRSVVMYMLYLTVKNHFVCLSCERGRLKITIRLFSKLSKELKVTAVPWHADSPFQEALRISASDTCFSLQQVLRKRYNTELKRNLVEKTSAYT